MRPKYATIKVPQAFADRIIDIAIQKQGTYKLFLSLLLN